MAANMKPGDAFDPTPYEEVASATQCSLDGFWKFFILHNGSDHLILCKMHAEAEHAVYLDSTFYGNIPWTDAYRIILRKMLGAVLDQS